VLPLRLAVTIVIVRPRPDFDSKMLIQERGELTSRMPILKDMPACSEAKEQPKGSYLPK
jgi:hypothetical protein